MSGAWGGCGSGQRTLKVFQVSQGYPHTFLLPEGADRLSLFSAPHPTVQGPDLLVQLFRWPQWQGAHPSVGGETDRREVKRPAHGPQLVMGECQEWVPGLNCGSSALPTAGGGGSKPRRASLWKELRTERAKSRPLCTEITLYGNPNSLAGSKCGYTDCCFLTEFRRLGLWLSLAKKSSIQQFISHFLSWAGVGGGRWWGWRF